MEHSRDPALPIAAIDERMDRVPNHPADAFGNRFQHRLADRAPQLLGEVAGLGKQRVEEAR